MIRYGLLGLKQVGWSKTGSADCRKTIDPKQITSNGFMSNKAFWDLVKPFLSNKGVLAGTDISLIKDDKIVTDDLDLCEIFNDYYINIVENTAGKKPSSIANANSIDDDRENCQVNS